MARFEWTSGLSVGMSGIDSQHKSLIGYINDLDNAMRQGKGKDVVGKTLKALIDYTASHFAEEERMMREHGYPELFSHKKAHDELVAKVLEFQKEFESGSVALSVQIMAFLKDWVVTHIQGTDRRYAPFFKSKGIN